MGTNVANTPTSGEESASSGEALEVNAIVHLAIVLRVMLTIGIVLILLGTAIGLIRDGKLPTPVISVSRLASLLVHLNPAAILSLTAPAVLGVLIGSQAGAHVSRHLKNVVLVRFLVLILVYLAVTLLLQAFGVHVPGTSSN